MRSNQQLMKVQLGSWLKGVSGELAGVASEGICQTAADKVAKTLRVRLNVPNVTLNMIEMSLSS